METTDTLSDASDDAVCKSHGLDKSVSEEKNTTVQPNDNEVVTSFTEEDLNIVPSSSQRRSVSVGKDNDLRSKVKTEYKGKNNSINLEKALSKYESGLSSKSTEGVIDNNNETNQVEVEPVVPQRSNSSMFEVNCEDDVSKASSLHSFYNVNQLNKNSNSFHQKHHENNINHFLQSIEIAAFTHMTQWSESADIIENKILKRDKESLMEAKTCTFTTETCRNSSLCFCKCCGKKRGLSTIVYHKNDFLCCCPYFRCCRHVQKPSSDGNPSLFYSNKFSRNIEAKYTLFCCPCLGQVRLTLLTSLFIWFDLPLEVVINRFRLLFSTTSQLIAQILEWIFFFSVLKADFLWSDDTSDISKGEEHYLYVRGSVLYVTTFCMFLPELLHILYMFYSPGYVMRSKTRKMQQVWLSLFSFLRPIYELVWSFKFSQTMPYTSLQHQGLIMSDSGLHERWIIWTGLVSSLRELPIRIIQLFILVEYFPFWSYSGNVFTPGEGTLEKCVGIHINETTLLQVISFGLFVSALALSDQVEREMPYGTFPRRFSRALSAPLCNNWTTLLWNIAFILVFFVDLFLRFFVLIPLANTEGLSSVLMVFLLLLTTTSTAAYFSLTLSSKRNNNTIQKTNELRDDKNSNNSNIDSSITATTAKTTNTKKLRVCTSLAFERKSLPTMLANVDTEKEEDTLRDSNGMHRVKSWSAKNKRSAADNYDSGMHLTAFDVVPSRCCCLSNRPKWMNSVIESKTFCCFSVSIIR